MAGVFRGGKRQRNTHWRILRRRYKARMNGRANYRRNASTVNKMAGNGAPTRAAIKDRIVQRILSGRIIGNPLFFTTADATGPESHLRFNLTKSLNQSRIDGRPSSDGTNQEESFITSGRHHRRKIDGHHPCFSGVRPAVSRTSYQIHPCVKN